VQVFESLEEIPRDFGPTVVSVGNYDGIHRAHQSLIYSICERAKELSARSVVLTFDPHPSRILRPHGGPPLITPMPRKMEILRESALDAVVVLPFTRDLSVMPPFEFAEEILYNRLHAIELHEGFNFQFGHKAEGTVERLQEFGRRLGFAVVTHAPMMWGELVISSSNVRAEVLGGRVEAARHLLGRVFSIDSSPGRGRGYGTKYTVPTVNLARYQELTPSFGVYVTEMLINGEEFQSVTNVGNRPTFGADSFAIESYILNFHPLDLTSDTPIRLSFLHRLRGEKKFPSVEELKEQIGKDVVRAQRYFRLCNKLRKHKPSTDTSGGVL
jgi:riboflavin kinase/FMN adenylyltransferase